MTFETTWVAFCGSLLAFAVFSHAAIFSRTVSDFDGVCTYVPPADALPFVLLDREH